MTAYLYIHNLPVRSTVQAMTAYLYIHNLPVRSTVQVVTAYLYIHNLPVRSTVQVVTAHLYDLVDVVLSRVLQQKFTNFHRHRQPLASILRYAVDQ